VNDSEQRIRQLLNESVDARLGPRRPAPPFAPRPVRRLRRFGPWAAPLVAAACVAAVVGATIGVAHLASSGQHPQPGKSVPAPTPTPTTAPSGPNGAPTSAPTESPNSPASTGRTTQPSATSVTVPANLDAWILSQPHPQLPTPCPSGFVLYKAPLSAHLTGSLVPDTVTRVNCRDTTSGANAEIDVYGATRGAYGLIYRVPLPTDRPGLQFSSGDPSVVGSVLTVTIAGYVETTGQRDPMCCPTTVWQQKYTFNGTTVRQGPLLQVSTQAASGRWTDSQLVITARALGAVSVGMTMTQAAHAAGFTSFTAIGDAVSIPTPWQGPARSAAGYPELYVSQWAGPSGSAQAFTCVGAFAETSTTKQVITTPEGVRLGDPASRILGVYGSRAHYVPAPQSGMDPRAGYVISDNGYDLVFKLDPHGRQIVAIVGGLDPVTPSTCVG